LPIWGRRAARREAEGEARDLPKAAQITLDALREAVDGAGTVSPTSDHIPANTKAVTLDQ
jgi:hypothetical protein